jgi:flagellar export protein FliJ
MKKFVFSLEKVLRYKRQILGMRKNELARLQAAHTELEEEITGLDREFASLNQDLAGKLKAGMDPRNMAVYKVYLAKLNSRVRVLFEQKQELLKQIQAKQKEIVRMNSGISGLERLRDKQYGEYMAQDRKEQEKFIEEFVGRKNAAE